MLLGVLFLFLPLTANITFTWHSAVLWPVMRHFFSWEHFAGNFSGANDQVWTVCGIQQWLPPAGRKIQCAREEKAELGRHPDRHFRESTCQAGSSTAYALLSRNSQAESQILAILLMWQIWWYKKYFHASCVYKAWFWLQVRRGNVWPWSKLLLDLLQAAFQNLFSFQT